MFRLFKCFVSSLKSHPGSPVPCSLRQGQVSPVFFLKTRPGPPASYLLSTGPDLSGLPRWVRVEVVGPPNLGIGDFRSSDGRTGAEGPQELFGQGTMLSHRHSARRVISTDPPLSHGHSVRTARHSHGPGVRTADRPSPPTRIKRLGDIQAHGRPVPSETGRFFQANRALTSASTRSSRRAQASRSSPLVWA